MFGMNQLFSDVLDVAISDTVFIEHGARRDRSSYVCRPVNTMGDCPDPLDRKFCLWPRRSFGTLE
jgi:hypothetical protein